MQSATRLADDETGGGPKPEVELRPIVEVANAPLCMAQVLVVCASDNVQRVDDSYRRVRSKLFV